MDKKEKKKLKAQYKQNEQDTIRSSIPMSIEELKSLLSFLNRAEAPECNHTLKETNEYIKLHNLDPNKIVPWLIEHGGGCDCEVIYNVYDDVGDIVGWHLDENA
jgi:intein/homing endonuclease